MTKELKALDVKISELIDNTAASIVGLAPHAQDSGKYRRQRHISGGRKDVQASLYMATLSGLRSNPALRAFAARLKARGKPAKVVIVAGMRTLIVILNAVLKFGQPARAPIPV